MSVDFDPDTGLPDILPNPILAPPILMGFVIAGPLFLDPNRVITGHCTKALKESFELQEQTHISKGRDKSTSARLGSFGKPWTVL